MRFLLFSLITILFVLEFKGASTSDDTELRSIYSRDTLNAWVVGGRGLVKHTTDGGKTWKGQPNIPNVWLYDIVFSDNNGWIVGYQGTIMRTTDGGIQWQKQEGHTRYGLNSVSNTDSIHCWIAGDSNTLLQTSDGGLSWKRSVVNTGSDLMEVQFLNKFGWVLTSSGEIFGSIDGGVHWRRLAALPKFDGYFRRFNFVDSKYGWLVGDYDSKSSKGRILHTTDGGYTWNDQLNKSDASFTRYELKDVEFINHQVGFAVGVLGPYDDAIVFNTTNSGDSWTVLHSPGDGVFSCVKVIDSSHAWTAGSRGVIHRISNHEVY